MIDKSIGYSTDDLENQLRQPSKDWELKRICMQGNPDLIFAYVKRDYGLKSKLKQKIDLIWAECFDSGLDFTVEQMSFISSQIANIKRDIDNL